ncbi:MAG: glycosyltransferase family 1 protein [Deltaproteobacteria bacterium]|nr:glycosyltransferase family 1 protein [Deltaproteobacteria bacterium]
MTRTVHVLSDGLRTPNSAALVYPLLVHGGALRDRGIVVRLLEMADRDYADCDLLIVDSKHFSGPERGQLSFVQDALQSFGEKVPLIWYDSTDSAGWLVGGVMPLVRRYFKNQLLRDRSAYTRPMYGRRAYTDYYHRIAGVTDSQPEDAPTLSDGRLLDRLRLGWNSGLADYSRWGPLRCESYRRFRFPALQARRTFSPASKRRRIQLSCRMGISYARDTVAYQRRQLAARLGKRLKTGKLGRGAYFAELRDSRLVVSPFGLGEITLKDFEVFLTGGLLVKPDMTHLVTWPDLYRPDETMAAFAWDLSDFEAVIDRYLSDPKRASDVAAAGQDRYLRHVSGGDAMGLFADRFVALVDEALIGADNPAPGPVQPRLSTTAAAGFAS